MRSTGGPEYSLGAAQSLALVLAAEICNNNKKNLCLLCVPGLQ